MNFAQFLETSSRRYPEKTALIVGPRRLSYQQLNERTRRLASVLSAMGFGSGDRIALAACNCLEYPEIVFACAWLGSTAVLLNWRLNTADLLRLIQRNQAKAIILGLNNPDKEHELSEALRGSLPVFHLRPGAGSRPYDDLLAEEAAPLPPACLPEDHVLMHLHTSGTTGVPKPVLYTHGNFSKEVLTYLYQLEVTAETVYQQMTQMFHSACIGMFGCLAIGATVIALDHFDMEEYLAAIQRERTTRLALTPSILRQIVTDARLREYDLSSLQEIAYSMAPMPPKLIQMAMEALPCKYYTTYGMTEMGPIVTAMRVQEHDQGRMFSVGTPIIGCDVRIAAPDGTPCAAGESGEIVVRGFGMAKGYLDMPEETAAAMQNGWFYTSDVGYLDAEGYLYLQGRKSNMIITGGENVYPAEVENAIHALFEEVREVAVYGVPDDTWGESVIASVVLNPGASLTEAEIRHRCRERLAGYQVPKRVLIESQLPRNQVGKVLIKSLVDCYFQCCPKR